MANNPGIGFEKAVTGIQSQIDPNSEVSHNKIITDRLGQNRQFDVVITGQFAGQDILGVIECKDLKKKVGTPEIDAFVTKSQDINANFKIIASRKGFTKPALKKAAHYGIQTLSLIDPDFKLGTYWHADVYHWEQMLLKLDFTDISNKKLSFDASQVTINGKHVVDWYKNYLHKHHCTSKEVGWTAGIKCIFDSPPVEIDIGNNRIIECNGIEFHAHRKLSKKILHVGLSGNGFFNWQNNKATVPPNTTLLSESVSTNFLEWEDRTNDNFNENALINIKIEAHISIETIENAIDLDAL